MFRCERCGSRYSAIHAAAFENCPRCQARHRIAVPLTSTTGPARRPLQAKPPKRAPEASPPGGRSA